MYHPMSRNSNYNYWFHPQDYILDTIESFLTGILLEYPKKFLAWGISYITPYSKFQMYRKKKIHELNLYEEKFLNDSSKSSFYCSTIYFSPWFHICIILGLKTCKYLFGHNDKFRDTVVYQSGNLKDSFKKFQGKFI